MSDKRSEESGQKELPAVKDYRDLLYLDPPEVRHTERISDLFYILFRREKTDQ